MKRLLAIALFATPLLAQASCGRVPVHIEGRVHDASGTPLRGAYVMVSWLELDSFVQQGQILTDRSGHYSITLYYNPVVQYTATRGHDCSGTLASIVIAASAPHHASIVGRRSIEGANATLDLVLPHR